jgi:hypothetical protein
MKSGDAVSRKDPGDGKKSRTAVITGGARGLGRCLAESCARRGFDLILADLDTDTLVDTAERLKSDFGVRVRILPGDLALQEVRDSLVDMAEAADSGIDLWVNNAGISAKGPASVTGSRKAMAVASLNVMAFTDLAVRSIPLLQRNPSGRMINVSSLGAFYPIPYMAAYASSKAYILHFSLALNRELARTGVTVSALCPGGMRTNELTIRDLDGQGFFGRLTIHAPEKVAEIALNRSEAGAAIIIPGLWNQFLKFLGGFFPKTFLAGNLEKRWRRSLVSSGLMKRD